MTDTSINYKIWKAEQALLSVDERACLGCLGHGSIGPLNMKKCPICHGTKVYPAIASSMCMELWWERDAKLTQQELLETAMDGWLLRNM